MPEKPKSDTAPTRVSPIAADNVARMHSFSDHHINLPQKQSLEALQIDASSSSPALCSNSLVGFSPSSSSSSFSSRCRRCSSCCSSRTSVLCSFLILLLLLLLLLIIPIFLCVRVLQLEKLTEMSFTFATSARVRASSLSGVWLEVCYPSVFPLFLCATASTIFCVGASLILLFPIRVRFP